VPRRRHVNTPVKVKIPKQGLENNCLAASEYDMNDQKSQYLEYYVTDFNCNV